MRDYKRTEETTTTVKHGFELPVNWTDVQKLLRIVLQEYGADGEPFDDELWYESDGEVLSLCYKK